MPQGRVFIQKLLALLLCTLISFAPVLSLSEESEAPVTHVGRATTTLKVRRAPDKSALGNDSIPKDSMVNILEYGYEWCKVRTQRVEGYVMTKYLADIQGEGGPKDDRAQEEEKPRELQGELQPGFTMNKSNFEEKFYAHALRNQAPVYSRPDMNAYQSTHVKIYKKVIVGEISGEWALVRYGSYYGYMLLSHLFKWDRIDPFAGDIPGLEIWPYLAFVNHTTVVRDIQTNKELQTINPGSAICVGEKDDAGRYPVPWDRQTGYVSEDEVAWLMPVVPWQEAQPGDLISVMTTFFGVGKSTLQIQGRNWNIHLASGMISGTVLQPGQEYNMNKTIGPYRKSTGYHSAPIMSDEALAGYGGGTCQVNTTFYITTMQVPLLVTHRKVHAEVGMHYAEQGFDAAVGGGDINLEMVNSLPYPIRYEFMNSDGVLTCCIFRAE